MLLTGNKDIAEKVSVKYICFFSLQYFYVSSIKGEWHTFDFLRKRSVGICTDVAVLQQIFIDEAVWEPLAKCALWNLFDLAPKAPSKWAPLFATIFPSIVHDL